MVCSHPKLMWFHKGRLMTVLSLTHRHEARDIFDFSIRA